MKTEKPSTEETQVDKNLFLKKYKQIILDWTKDNKSRLSEGRKNYSWNEKEPQTCLTERNQISKSITFSRTQNSGGIDLETLDMIMSFGGIPLLYYGDEIGMLNDFSYMEDEAKANDTRWIHRPVIDWDKSELRHKHGTPEQRLFEGIARMSAVRKNTPAFADFNNRELITTGNEHLFAFMRSNPADNSDSVLVVANFDGAPQSLNLADLGNRNRFGQGNLRDLYSGEAPNLFNDQLVVPPFRFYWLTDQG